MKSFLFWFSAFIALSIATATAQIREFNRSRGVWGSEAGLGAQINREDSVKLSGIWGFTSGALGGPCPNGTACPNNDHNFFDTLSFNLPTSIFGGVVYLDLSELNHVTPLQTTGTQVFSLSGISSNGERLIRIKHIVLPDNLGHLSEGLFAYNRNLETLEFKNVRFSNSLINIPKGAFYFTPKLRRYDGLRFAQTIGEAAFAHSYGMSKIELPDVRHIERHAFFNNRADSIIIGRDIARIDGRAFGQIAGRREIKNFVTGRQHETHHDFGAVNPNLRIFMPQITGVPNIHICQSHECCGFSAITDGYSGIQATCNSRLNFYVPDNLVVAFRNAGFLNTNRNYFTRLYDKDGNFIKRIGLSPTVNQAELPVYSEDGYEFQWLDSFGERWNFSTQLTRDTSLFVKRIAINRQLSFGSSTLNRDITDIKHPNITPLGIPTQHGISFDGIYDLNRPMFRNWIYVEDAWGARWEWGSYIRSLGTNVANHNNIITFTGWQRSDFAKAVAEAAALLPSSFTVEDEIALFSPAHPDDPSWLRWVWAEASDYRYIERFLEESLPAGTNRSVRLNPIILADNLEFPLKFDLSLPKEVLSSSDLDLIYYVRTQYRSPDGIPDTTVSSFLDYSQINAVFLHGYLPQEHYKSLTLSAFNRNENAYKYRYSDAHFLIAGPFVNEPSANGYVFEGWSYKITPFPAAVADDGVRNLQRVTRSHAFNQQTDNDRVRIWNELLETVGDYFTFSGEYNLTAGGLDEDGNAVVFARWTPVEYTVSFKADGENSFQKIPFNIESPDITLPVPVSPAPHVVFAGWNGDAELCAAGKTLRTGNFGDKILTAQWAPAHYPIIYNDPLSIFTSGAYPFSAENAFTLPVPTAPDGFCFGYTFGGWFDNDRLLGTPVTQIPAGSHAAVELWAMWTSKGGVSVRPSQNPAPQRYGILLDPTIASDFVKISVITPEPAQIRLKILDNLGNAVFETAAQGQGTAHEIVWNLSNAAGRFVGNGTYLIVVEATGIGSKVYMYSTRIGVRR